jgi:hypothetical protein
MNHLDEIDKLNENDKFVDFLNNILYKMYNIKCEDSVTKEKMFFNLLLN